MKSEDLVKLGKIRAWAEADLYLDTGELVELVTWLANQLVESGQVIADQTKAFNEQTKVILDQQKMLNDLSERIRTVDLLRELVSKTGPKDAVD